MEEVIISVVNNAKFGGEGYKVKAIDAKDEVCKHYYRLVHEVPVFDADHSFLNYDKAYAEVSDGLTITTIQVLKVA